MFLSLLLLICALFAIVQFLFWPIIHYWRDPKGLRKYPNYSLLSTISDWPFCLLSARGYRSRDLTTAHKTLNAPVLRIGPNNLSFAHADVVKDIYGHGTTCVKDIRYSLDGGHRPNLFSVVNKEDHGAKRKRLSAAFATKHLVRWEWKVVKTTERLVTAFDRHCTEPLSDDSTRPDPNDVNLDYNWWINLFTIEAINNICLTSDLGLLERGDDVVTAMKADGSQYQACYRESQDATAYAASHFVWDYKYYHLRLALSKLSPSWRKIWREARPWTDIVNYQVQTRMRRHQAGEALDDFFTALMEDKAGTPYHLPFDEIMNEINGLINAGADTTAIALTQVLLLLLKNPEHLQTLRDELDRVLGPDEVVAPYDKIKHLPFLKACLDEGLRLIPPVPAGLPRRTPPGGARIMGQWVPGDTSVSMTIYAAHHDPNIFSNPEQYDPRRWMDTEGRRKMESHFIPFSTGGRGCLGRNISYLEQQIVLSTIVHRYDFWLPGPDFEIERFEALNLQLGKMPLKIARRKVPVGGGQ